MKYLLVFSLLLFSCHPDKTVSWKTCDIPEAGAQLLLPSPFTTTSSKEDTPFGNLEQTYCYWRNANWDIRDLGLKLVSFSYITLPAGRIPPADQALDQYFRHFQREHGLENPRLVYDFATTGISGRGLEAVTHNGKDDSLVSYARILVSGSRIYELYINGYQAHFDSALANRVLNSLQLP